MSKKDYKEIAKIIRQSNGMEDLITSLCIYFKSENERFDSKKFREACRNEN